MRLIGVGMAVACCVAGLGPFAARTTLAAQEIKTTITETTKFHVVDGHDLRVTGCVRAFEDAGFMLTDANGRMTFVLVTDENLAKHVGHRVEIHGLGSESDDGAIEIERAVGTSGVIGGEKIEGATLKRTKQVSGDVGFAYVSVESVKTIKNDCR